MNRQKEGEKKLGGELSVRMRKLKYDKKGCHAKKGNCEITSGKKIRWVIITMTSMTTHIQTLQCCIQNCPDEHSFTARNIYC